MAHRGVVALRKSWRRESARRGAAGGGGGRGGRGGDLEEDEEPAEAEVEVGAVLLLQEEQQRRLQHLPAAEARRRLRARRACSSSGPGVPGPAFLGPFDAGFDRLCRHTLNASHAQRGLRQLPTSTPDPRTQKKTHPTPTAPRSPARPSRTPGPRHGRRGGGA